jgi:DNA-binding beta-propeller fold protein YncE
MRELALVIGLFCVGCAAPRATSTATSTPPAANAVQAIALPGAPAGGVFMDYLAYDRARGRVWVPAGNTGAVDVVDVASGRVDTIAGFPTQEMERRGRKRVVGPSSATVGDGVVYVGNRGDSTVCAVKADSLEKGACAHLDSMPDGLAYVASSKEVWVTTPRATSIAVLDAATLALKDTIRFEGEPEGYAVDDARGVFYTNLEDKDLTLTIDIQTRKVTRTWLPRCGEDGPKGLALDHARSLLFVACADKVKTFDQNGKELSSLDTGIGVDNIDYVESRHELFAAAARAAKLTIAGVDESGALKALRVVPTANGARNAVATETGAAYLTDSPEGKILLVAPERR